MPSEDLPAALERLVALGRTPDINIRPVLLRVLIDLFVSKPDHGAEAIRQFAEIVPRLLDEADRAALLIVAAKLGGHPNAPRLLLDRLLAERGAVAAAVLAQAGLDTPTLQAAAAFGSPDMAKAVAGRCDLDPATVRALVERPEPEVLRTLAANKALPIDEKLYRQLVRRAREDDGIAACLLRRDMDPLAHLALFISANRAQRAAILAALRRHDLGLPRSAPVPGGREACERIDHAALTPGWEGLDLILCQSLDLPASVAEQIVEDPGGEPMAVALAALGASPELAGRLFILGPPAIGHDYAAVKHLAGIVERVSPGAARRLIDSLRNEGAVQARRRTSPPATGRAAREPERRPSTAPALRRAG